MIEAEIKMFERSQSLSFDEFQQRSNNFYMHFLPLNDMFGGAYRKKPYCQQFEKDHQELAAKLQTEIAELFEFMSGKKKPPAGSPYEKISGLRIGDVFEMTDLPVWKDLYEVYLEVRKYVDDDQKLFS
jgi:hypothetical protein